VVTTDISLTDDDSAIAKRSTRERDPVASPFTRAWHAGRGGEGTRLCTIRVRASGDSHVSSSGSRLATVVKFLSLSSSPRTCSLYMIQACGMQRFQRNRKLEWKREALGPQAVSSLG